MKITEKEQQEFDRATDAWEKYKRIRALKALFEKNSISCDITDYKHMQRAFC